MKIGNRKILILVPSAIARGGISNYYQVLKNEFSAEIEYFERGSRTWPLRNGFFNELIRARNDFKIFKSRLGKNDISLVQSSTSLGFSTTIRDGLFLKYAQRKGVKTIAYFRGWDKKAEYNVEKRYLRLFKYFFFSTNCVIVLSQKAKDRLKDWGYNGEIIVETTVIDKRLIEGVSTLTLTAKYFRFQEKGTIRFLFISRIEKRKGIYELIEAFKILKKQLTGYDFSLCICGDGSELTNIENKILNENIQGIVIKGFVSGEQKKNAFLDADLFLFPSYEEGMPNAVLEAMGFGLPIITTKVGGVKDFFVDNINGFTIEIGNPIDLSKKIMNMMTAGDKLKDFSLSNYDMANRIFRSDVVARRIESLFQRVINP